MKFFDRLLTIVITATLTSAVWIVFGTTLISMAEGESAKGKGETPEVVEPPAPTPIIAPEAVETPSAPAPPPAKPAAEASESPKDAPIVTPTPEIEPEAVNPAADVDTTETDASITA